MLSVAENYTNNLADENFGYLQYFKEVGFYLPVGYFYIEKTRIDTFFI